MPGILTFGLKRKIIYMYIKTNSLNVLLAIIMRYSLPKVKRNIFYFDEKKI